MSKTSDKEDEKYTTVGTIKTVVLTKGAPAFTLEPLSAYRFQTKDDDEKSWKMIFKNESTTSVLKLVEQDLKFKVKECLSCALVVLKQNKTRIEVSIAKDPSKVGNDPVDATINIK